MASRSERLVEMARGEVKGQRTEEITDLTSIDSAISTNVDVDANLFHKSNTFTKKRCQTAGCGIKASNSKNSEDGTKGKTLGSMETSDPRLTVSLPKIETLENGQNDGGERNKTRSQGSHASKENAKSFCSSKSSAVGVQRNSTSAINNSFKVDVNAMCPYVKGINAETRRVSVQMGANMRGNFVVTQSDLWDTQTLTNVKQHFKQLPRTCSNQQRCPEHNHIAPYESNTSLIQRSVSEKKGQKHRNKPPKGTSCQSETDSEKEKDAVFPSAQLHRLINIKPIQQHAHHHSSPNVAPDKRNHRKHGSMIFCASSESELLDANKDILPIFRKLLTEKQPRYKEKNMLGQSCPNILIKCDIVEYL